MVDESLPERPPPPPTWRDLLDGLVPGDRARLVRVAAAVLAVAVTGAAAWWALRPPPAPATEAVLPFAPGAPGGDDASTPAATGTTTATTAAPAEDLLVHAAGAVASPGVHRIPAGARVADLLAAAGGPTPDADLDRVNLAAPLADGERVWIPRAGEDAPPAVVAGGGTVAPAGRPGAGGPAAPAVVDVNAATAAELETLPGIGPAIAAAVVEHRERHGPFRSVDDLLEVRGIGPAKLEDLRDLVTV